MIVAGVMSGTSADGINVALVRILGRGSAVRLQLLGFTETPYPANVRKKILGLMNADDASVADLSRLNFLVGELYARAVNATQKQHRVRAELIGCHGQTIYHQGASATFLGRSIACTWQTGEGAVVAARCGTPVVSDFRPADMAAGGQGAPLVPYFDYIFYRHPRRARILLNIGGIANLTAIPAAANLDDLIAFDTGPGNMVIDACMERIFSRRMDEGGAVAAQGMPIARVLRVLLTDPYLRARPPKTAGREQFGREFVTRFLRLCARAAKHDIIATATAFTAESIALAVSHLAKRQRCTELIAAGGGTKNRTLMRMIQTKLGPLGIVLRSSDDFGIPSEAKEAVAFALLAYETWNHRPANVPSATGARRPAILGKISLPPRAAR